MSNIIHLPKTIDQQLAEAWKNAAPQKPALTIKSWFFVIYAVFGAVGCMLNIWFEPFRAKAPAAANLPAWAVWVHDHLHAIQTTHFLIATLGFCVLSGLALGRAQK